MLYSPKQTQVPVKVKSTAPSGPCASEPGPVKAADHRAMQPAEGETEE